MTDNFESAFALFMTAAQAAVNEDYKRGGFAGPRDENRAPVLTADRGARYIRIVSNSGSQRSAFGFVDKITGDVLKSAGWKGPAKNFARGNIRDERYGVGRIRWTGVQ
jgi:hypothetical protein